MVEVHRQKSTKLARKPAFVAKTPSPCGPARPFHRVGERICRAFARSAAPSECAERLRERFRWANALSVCANDFAGRLHGALRRAFVRNDYMERLHGVPAPGASLPCATLHACCTKPLAPSAGTIWLLALIGTALWSVLAPRAVHLAVSWTTRQCAARLRRYEEQS